MVSWNKADGGLIRITFSQPLVGDMSGNQARFFVTWKEYNYVPGGALVDVSGDVLATYAGETDTELILEMVGTERFCSAVGDVTVAYDGAGTLFGDGGPVEAFEETFTPAGLVAKPRQMDAEAVAVSAISAAGTLTLITFSEYQEAPEHAVAVSGVSASGTLTHIDDL